MPAFHIGGEIFNDQCYENTNILIQNVLTRSLPDLSTAVHQLASV
jgi:hypothetical protein